MRLNTQQIMALDWERRRWHRRQQRAALLGTIFALYRQIIGLVKQ